MRKFAANLSLQIFVIHISLGKVMMKHSSCQFCDKFSGFGHQSEKFSHIGTCIRHNFTPCTNVPVCVEALQDVNYQFISQPKNIFCHI